VSDTEHRAPARWRDALVASLREAGWAPVLVFLAHVVASLGFGAYAAFPPLDIPMHFFGGIAITFFYARAYRAAERRGLLGRPAKVLYFLAVPAFATSTTVFWELAEFLSDRYLGTRSQLGLGDTLFDMFLGCLGSLVFLGVEMLVSVRGASPQAARPARERP
jgi:hypothetical protein